MPVPRRTSFAAGTKLGDDCNTQGMNGNMKEFYKDRKRSVLEGNHAGKCGILDVGGDRFVASQPEEFRAIPGYQVI